MQSVQITAAPQAGAASTSLSGDTPDPARDRGGHPTPRPRSRAVEAVRGRTTATALCCAFGALLLAGCGSDDAADERIARERADAAEQARQQERLRQLERELRDLNKERGASDGRARPPAQSPSPSPAPAPSPSPSGRKDCGSGISVGPNTTCTFAVNVRDRYIESEGAGTINVYSPVTKQTYTMTCTAGTETACRGGNNASVFFR